MVKKNFRAVAECRRGKFAINEVDYLAQGLQITNDVAGDSKLGKTQIMPSLTFHKSVNGDKDTYLSLGGCEDKPSPSTLWRSIVI